MRRRTWPLVAVAIVVALGAAFWWLDFRVASSQTNTTSNVATASGGSRPPDYQPPALGVHVAGDDVLAGAVRDELVGRLGASGKFANVTSLATAPERGSGHLLLVEVERGPLTWTPVYSRAELTVKLAYASNGDATLDRQTPVVMVGPDKQVVNVTGDLQVDDVTWGLVSRPGYQRLLGQRIGADIADALVKALDGVPS